MTDTKPNRRWFQFSLRTFLVVAMLIGGWLGWQVHIVWQRKDLLYHWKKDAGVSAIVFLPGERPLHSDSPPEVSWIRNLLGDSAVESIFLLGPIDGDTDEEANQARKVFPEAELIENPTTPPIG